MVKDELVLEHDTRRMIYNYIVEHPGVAFNELKKVFELTDGTLRYHIDYLKRSGKITNGLAGGKRVYYQNISGKLVTTLKSKQGNPYKLSIVQQQIINAVEKNPGINHNELASKTRLTRFKLRKNIVKLMDIGILRKMSHKNKVCYECITDGELEYKVVKTLVIKLLSGEIDEETFLEMKRRME